MKSFEGSRFRIDTVAYGVHFMCIRERSLLMVLSAVEIENLSHSKNVLQFQPISAHNQTPPIVLSELTTSLLNAMGYMVT